MDDLQDGIESPLSVLSQGPVFPQPSEATPDDLGLRHHPEGIYLTSLGNLYLDVLTQKLTRLSVVEAALGSSGRPEANLPIAPLGDSEQRLGKFEATGDKEYLPIDQSCWRSWGRLTPFFDYPPEIRKMVNTINAIESMNMSLRKLIKNRCSFPSDGALLNAVLSYAEKHQPEVDHTDSGLEGGADSRP
jgi:hypothetical protein